MALRDRNPLSVEGAIAKQIDIIGAKEAAYIVGLSLTTVYGATSETENGTLNELARLKLDAACLSRHGTTPYIDYQRRVVEQMAAAGQNEPKPVEIAALEVSASAGLMQDALLRAKCPQSDGGSKITPREAKELIALCLEVRRATDLVINAVNHGDGKVVLLRNEGPVK